MIVSIKSFVRFNPQKRQNKTKAFIIVFAFAILGCQKQGPDLKPPRLEKDWLNSVYTSRAQLRALQAEASVEIYPKRKKRKRRFRFHLSILAAEPENLFVEAHGIGFSPSIGLSNSKETFVYIPSKKEVFHGDKKKGLSALLGIELSSKEFVSLLLGKLPSYGKKVTQFQTKRGRTFLTVGREKNQVELIFQSKTGWLIEFKNRKHRIRFGKPIKTDIGLYPSQIKIRTFKGSISIRFKEVVVDPILKKGVFTLTLPEGLAHRFYDDAQLLKGF